MIHLQTLNKKELEEFVSSGNFKKYSFLPISEHRAKSHFKNPKASEEQTLLILAFDDSQLAGYLGCLPDNFKINGKSFNYAWLSTLYISDQFRGKRIAQTLLNKAFEEYNGNIVITEFTQEAENLYNKIGIFQYIEPKKGIRYYFRTDLATIIPAKKPQIKPLKPVLKLVDFIGNSLISIKNRFIKKPGFRFEIHDKVDTESKVFMSAFQSNRNADEINWLIENPWILEGEMIEKDYLFSSFSKIFKYFWIKVHDQNNTLITCSLLLLRDGHLKVPYLFTGPDLHQFVHFLNYFIVKEKIKTLTSYQTGLNQVIKDSAAFPKIHERSIERRYMFHKQLIQNLPEKFDPKFQDGDGDCAMT